MRHLVCVSGVTGVGKTTLSLLLLNFFINPQNQHFFQPFRINKVNLVHQDDYYWPVGHINHKYHPGTNVSDRRALTSLNIEKLTVDLEAVPLDEPNDLNILILEGSHIYNIPDVNELCDFRFKLNISYEAALKRRANTDRWWSNTTEVYFNRSSWPTYQSFFDQIPNKNQLIYLNGELSAAENLKNVVAIIKEKLNL